MMRYRIPQYPVGEIITSDVSVMTRWNNRVLLIRCCEAQNWRCCYCYQKMDIHKDGSKPKRHNASREHVIPKSRGGGDEYDNIVAACHACNNERSDRDPYSYRPRGAWLVA